MCALDLSANKCYPLVMPNTNNEDPRLRLDCRTGASIEISNSRIFVYGGCTLPIDLPPDFTIDTIYNGFINKLKENNNNQINWTIDFNEYLSSECFRLSLINKKWCHYKMDTVSSSTVIPEPRMFHIMSICDNYIYVLGGLKFNKENKLEILNDLWRFDTIEKNWKCYYENGNSEITKRFDHLATVLPNMEFLDKTLVHPGICIAGGINESGEYINKLEVFDILDDKLAIQRYPNLQEFQNLETPDGEIQSGIILNLRQSKNTLYSLTCQVSNQLKFVITDKSPDVNSLEPFVMFIESTQGVRIPHKSDFDISDISTMHYATIGVFGENIILIGFIGDEKRISAYIFNIRTSAWTKLNISCLHKLYTHKLCKGFVWESHHKAAFLGSMEMKDTAASVIYFDNLIALSLPFTNFFGKKPVVNQHRGRYAATSSSASIHSATRLAKEVVQLKSEVGMRIRSDSIPSVQSNFSHGKTYPTTLNDNAGGFAAYSYHVAQQLQVNSIRSVLPPYAIAIGKTAFERSITFSDLDLVCSDGTIIPVPLVLCRRRWGSGFDEIFASAYAMCFVESKAHDIISSRGSSAYDSNESTETDDHSLATKYSATLNFRYPFQERDVHFRNDISPVRDIHKGASSNNSRQNSVSGSLFHSSSLNRALKLLSDSRRNSYNIGQSQQTSGAYLPASRRSSLNAATNPNTMSPRRNSFNFNPTPSRRDSLNLNVTSSRRNSASMLQIAQANTRRNSRLSRASFASTSSSSTHSSNHNSRGFTPGLEPFSQSLPVTKSQHDFPPVGPTEKNDSVLHYPHLVSSESLCSSEEPLPHNELTSIKLDALPPQLPMPTVLPDEFKSKSSSTTLSQNSNTEDTYADNRDNSNSLHAFNDDLVDLIYNTESPADMASKFNPLNIPRCLYLPYSKNTVRAIVEYMYSGQIGATWKLFPTGIELLIATKQLGIPLLYDLVLELFFVVLSIIESSLKAKLILYLEGKSEKKMDASCDKLYSLLDVKSTDDLDMDLELLFEAAGNARRDSGSTLNSDLMVSGEENKDSEEQSNSINGKFGANPVNSVDPLDSSSMEKTGSLLRTFELSPTNTNATVNTDQSEGLKTNITVIEDYEFNHKYDHLGVTAASLNEDGYEVTDDSDSGDEEILIKPFRKYNLKNNNEHHEHYEHNNNNDNNDNNITNNEGETTENHENEATQPKKKTKLKEWPTFKDMLSEENAESVNEVMLELFIETGALINDSKLMLQSIHIQYLLKILKDLDNHDNDTSTKTEIKSDAKPQNKTNNTLTNVEAKIEPKNDVKPQNKNIESSDNGKQNAELTVTNEPIDLASALITGEFGSSLFNLADEQARKNKSDQCSITSASTEAPINKTALKKDVLRSPHPLQQVTQIVRNNSDVSAVSVPSVVSRGGNHPSGREKSHFDEVLHGKWKKKIATTTTTIGNAPAVLQSKFASSLYDDSSHSLKTVFSRTSANSSNSGNSGKTTKEKKKKKGFFSRFKRQC